MINKMYLAGFATATLLIGLSYSSFGQSYGTAAGLRLGNNQDYRTIGITGKQRLMKGITAEGIIQSDFSSNTTAHLLLARHRPMISKRFNYYYGGGFSVGLEESRRKIPESMQIITTYGNPTMGVDFILGAEMTVMKMNISLDYKPNINLVGKEQWYAGQVGISVRPVIVTGKDQQKKKRQKARKKRKAQKNANPGPFKRLLQDIRNQ
jgi:hypothetical protein